MAACSAAVGLKFKFLSHNKAQATTNVVRVNGISPMYFFISEQGNVSVFNSSMELARTHACFVKVKEDRKPCITSVAYLEDCEKLAVATTHQKIHFYDISATIFLEEYQITNLPFHPSCLFYRSQTTDIDNPSILAVGTISGSVYLFHFSTPTNMLFKKQDQYQVQKIPFKEIQNNIDHAHLVRLQSIKSIHKASIYQMHIHHTYPRLFSCSRGDHTTSLAITDIPGKLKTYRASVESGISCFDLSRVAPIVVTGSSDTLVRVWNFFATRRPVAVLQGHQNSVIAVRFIREEEQVITLSRDGVFFLWSAGSWECAGQMFLPFPAFFILGHKPKFTLSPMYSDEDQIFITCSQWFVRLLYQQYPLVRLDQTKTEESIEEEGNVETDLSQLLTSSAVEANGGGEPSGKKREISTKEPDEATKRMMRRFVADGGPHWALKMYPLEDIDLSHFPTWKKVNERVKAAAAEKSADLAGSQLAKQMMTLKASIAFRQPGKI